MNTTAMRSRWAAIGAAVAVVLGAGSIGLVTATSPSDATAYVPVTPCRIADTRPPFLKGPKATPIGANQTHTIGITDTNTDCTGPTAIPATATGLQLNVTAIGATAPTFLTFYEAGTSRPTSSSLNPTPGQPPTPNAVPVKINSQGKFSVYNLAGTIDVAIDIVGYYTDHNHDDRYYQKTEVDTKVASAYSAPLVGLTSFGPANTPQSVRTLTLPEGNYLVTASLVINNNRAGQSSGNCKLLLGTATIDRTSPDTPGLELGANAQVGSRESVSLVGAGAVPAGGGDAKIECEMDTSSGNYLGITLTALKVSSLTASTSAPVSLDDAVDSNN